MSQYVLNSSNFQPNMVGGLYHVGLSDGTRSFGYMLQNTGGTEQRAGLLEASDVTTKSALIQYSSPNLIDRDLVFYPRVSQGDYSGGALQVVQLDPTKFLDSDLDITVPGYLTLAKRWQRDSRPLGIRSAGYQQVIAYNGFLYFSWCEASGNVYRYDPVHVIWVTGVMAAAVNGLFTDGATVYFGTATQLWYDNSAGALTVFATIATSLNGTAIKWWTTNQGTNGRFAYYIVRSSGVLDTLYKIDLNAARPVAPANQPQVPTGSQAMYIEDLIEYQNGIAILATDASAVNGFDVWYHDGNNMTRIVRVEGYHGQGLCQCLGDLYVSALDLYTFGGPILAKVATGSYEVVLRPGMPGAFGSVQAAGQPRSAGEYVYWPTRLTSTPLGLLNSGSPTPRLMFYNTLTGSSGFLPNLDATDWGPDVLADDLSSQRNVATVGNSVAFTYHDSGAANGVVQFQDSLAQHVPPRYQTTGTLVSSKQDFQTPGIAKRIRRIQLNHTPLNAGESITAQAFVDLDPIKYTSSLTPNATVTNSTVGSHTTTLTMGADTVGHTIYYVLKLQSGTSNTTTPIIYYEAIEVGGTWTWKLKLDCTSRRRLLNQAMEDPQGVTGKDLYFLLRNAYENGTSLTLYLAEGVSYTVNIESLDAQAVGYVDRVGTPVRADEEWLVDVTLRQELV